jgi:hypothetical protein
MKKKAKALIFLSLIFVLIFVVILPAVIVLVLFLIKVLWAWTIPSVFPGAVKQGLIAGSISWLTAFKVFLMTVIIARIVGIRPEKAIKLGGKLDEKLKKFFSSLAGDK